MLAAVNLTAEYWHLARLVIALLQPLLVLLLVAGLVVATAHLLTMIGTRWGDRRASSKAMFFSVTIHLLLAMGLITLIPEYRSNLFAKLAELDNEPIRIVNTPDPSETEAEDGQNGTTPLFDRIPESVQPEWKRTQAPQQESSQIAALEKPSAAVPFEPQMAPDVERLPEPPRPLPQQEVVKSESNPEQADAEINTETLPTQARPEPLTPSMTRERSVTTSIRQTDPQAPQRPDQGSVDRQSTSYSPDRQAPNLSDMVTPNAELTRSDDETISRRSGPAPSRSVPELLGQQRQSTPDASRPGAPVDPQMSRTQSRTTIPSMQSLALDRVRSRISPATGNVPERMEVPSRPRGNALPLPLDRPQLARTSDPFGKLGDQDRVPSAYRLRTDEEREKAITKFGGSDASEAAVDRSLKWMASVQNPDGYWDASEFGAGKIQIDENGVDRKFAGREADVGVTALAVLAFLGKLNTVDQGEYSPQVNRALRWIVSQQREKNWGDGWGSTPGYLGGNATDFESMYCHAMATFALGEAYAMSRDNVDAQWLRAPLEQAINFILDVQNADGGWRYVKGQREGDMSIFGWQVMAIKSAEAAGIEIDEERKLRMQKFLNDRRLGAAGGLASYRLRENVSASMTAEALYCRQMLGIAIDPEATREATKMLLANLPTRKSLNFYYWYYGTLAMYQQGGEGWEQWNSAVRDLLVSEQRQTGELAGSWDPRDVWGGYGGRMYSTAVATLSLEVYYRYLPLYRLNEN